MSFISGGRTRSRFVGVFDLVGVSTDVAPLSPDYPFPDAPRGSYKYELQKLDGLEALEDRLIVDWGAGTRSWVQWLRPKPVIEVLPQGYAREFPGYDDVVLSFREMKRIVDHPDANRVWQRMLRSAAGVYLILDRKSGSQYVGSAAGAGGLLGRWRTYAKSKHGNNTRLEELLRSDSERYRQFTFSILRTLPRTMTKKEVVAVESVYKAKLGTRAFGLNGN